MLFTDHGLQAGLTVAIPLHLAGVPDIVTWTAFSIAAVGGAWPDLVGIRFTPGEDREEIWRWGKLVIYQIGRAYMHWHFDPLSGWELLLGPGVELHRKVDKPFHAAGPRWWPREKWRCIAWWAAELAGLTVLIFVEPIL
jgi:hypothetical protein